MKEVVKYFLPTSDVNIRNFILNFFIFVSRTVLVTKLVTLGILSSTSLIFVLRTAVVAKPLISGVLF